MANGMTDQVARRLANLIESHSALAAAVRLDEVDGFVVDVLITAAPDRQRALWTLYDEADWNYWRERILAMSKG